MTKLRWAHLLGAASLIAFAGSMAPRAAHAQVERVTPADIAPLPSFFKGQAPSGAPIPRPPGVPNPSKNPRDIAGFYDGESPYADAPAATDATVLAGGGGPGGPGGPPGGGGGPPGGLGRGGPGLGGPGAGPVSIASVKGQSFNRQACLPTFEIGRGFHPGQIVVAKDVVVIIGENNHEHQIIYLNSQHPANFQPTRVGDSVGHWEGNTLVVDVIGVKGQGHMVERIRKLSNGDIENLVTYDDGRQQVATMHWRPDLPLLEDICEDFAEAYGKTYTDTAPPNLNSSVVK